MNENIHSIERQFKESLRDIPLTVSQRSEIESLFNELFEIALNSITE